MLPLIKRQLDWGSGRIVFEGESDTVVKVAKNNFGLRQNAQEVCLYASHRDLLPIAPILDFADNFSWLIMPMAEKIGSLSLRVICKLANLTDPYVADVSSHNCGLINKIPMVIDYGIGDYIKLPSIPRMEKIFYTSEELLNYWRNQ